VARADAGITVTRVNTPVYTVDRIECEYGIKFNAVIMDIEGGELSFIEENGSFLGGVDLLIVEFHHQVIGDDVTRAADMLRDHGFINIETTGSSEVWTKPSRLGIAAPRLGGPVAIIGDLPAVPVSGAHQAAWDGVDGLYVNWKPRASPGLAQAVELVAAATAGRHRLGIRFEVAVGVSACRVTALVRPKIAALAYLEMRDGSSTKYGIAVYDLRTGSCIRAAGDLLDAGVEAGESGWLEIWCELPCAVPSAAAYVGIVSPAGDLSYRGDGRSGLDFLRFEFDSEAPGANGVG